MFRPPSRSIVGEVNLNAAVIQPPRLVPGHEFVLVHAIRLTLDTGLDVFIEGLEPSISRGRALFQDGR